MATLVVHFQLCPTKSTSCSSCMILLHKFLIGTYIWDYFHFNNPSFKVMPFTLHLFHNSLKYYCAKRSCIYASFIFCLCYFPLGRWPLVLEYQLGIFPLIIPPSNSTHLGLRCPILVLDKFHI